MPTVASTWVFYPVKEESLAAGDAWAQDPAQRIGNGPFRMASFAGDQVIGFAANEHYWAGRPKLDGIEVAKRLRTDGEDVPILMLTARDALESRVEGLDTGADDYLVKPFALEELKARMRSLGRRTAGRASNRIGHMGVEIDLESLAPRRLPALFAGSPLVVSGRFKGSPGGAVTVRGRDAAGQPWSAYSSP